MNFEAGIGELFFTIPPEAHASFCGCDGILKIEGTRAGLLPIGGVIEEDMIRLGGVEAGDEEWDE